MSPAPALALGKSTVPYRPIADYGAIGDGRSVALVSRDGSIDWWCPGRFDAPSVFSAVLDSQRGGSFRIAPVGESASVARYIPETNVMDTIHTTGTGAVRVVDFSPPPEMTGIDNAVIIRRVTGLHGEVELDVRYEPRFQYGEKAARFFDAPHGLLARGGGQIMLLRGPALPLKPSPGVRAARLVVREGETVEFILRHRPFDTPVPFANPLALSPRELEERVVAADRAFSAATRFDGPDARLVRRAALALRLLQHAPTGAIVAAPTASLPEAVGGVRNWDYRFAWVRDGALSARALHALGHEAEAAAFCEWLGRAIPSAEEMRIMYSVSGSTDLPEVVLPHLEGYRGSAPVRIGNEAVTQRQLDVYGELVDFLHLMRQRGLDERAWTLVRQTAEWVVAHWREPDSGIWEMRSAPRHFVLSKAMAWAALHRAADIARERNEEALAARWDEEARVVRADVLANGRDPATGAFSQAYGFDIPDASNLMLPIIGFVDADDPSMRATVDATLAQLTVDGLVYRYVDAHDGIAGTEATFTYCTFWLVEVLAMQGRVAEARAMFDRLVARATPLGLYAEEMEPFTGEHLGNYPQGFPHAGLIGAAMALRRAEARAAGTGGC